MRSEAESVLISPVTSATLLPAMTQRRAPRGERGRRLWEAAERAGFDTVAGLARHLADNGGGTPDHSTVERWRREINRWTANDGSFNAATAEFLAEKLGTPLDFWPTTRPRLVSRVAELETQTVDLRREVRRLASAVAANAQTVQEAAELQLELAERVALLEQRETPRQHGSR